MSYVDKSLLTGEQVKYRAHLHRIMFFWPALLALIGLALFSVSAIGAGVVLLVACATGLIVYVRYSTSEFAVTDKRVIIKVGVLHRLTLEMLLTQVEAIAVDQGVWGRLFGWGSITVAGTGGTREQFRKIADPLEFRRAVQQATL